MRFDVVQRRGLGPLRLFRLAVAIVVAAVCTFGTAAGASARASRPVISKFGGSVTVPSGGTATVSAIVSGASSCTITSSKPVAGLPATLACASGTVSRTLTMPINLAKKPAKYKLTLVASGGGTSLKASATAGSAKAKMTLAVMSGAARPEIASGGQHTCALLSSARVMCWGSNEYGQLGNNSAAWTGVPVEVGRLPNASQLSSGDWHSCALVEGGEVQCWGNDFYGQLGNGERNTSSHVPVTATGLTGVTEVAAGAFHTCALLETGHVDCWGWNSSGQLGTGDKVERTTPTPVVGISNALAIAAGGDDTCALLPEGHVSCWGDNWFGELGPGAEKRTSSVPVEVPGISGATAVSTGPTHTCVLLAGGSVDCWGENGSGALGDGSLEQSAAPVEVHGVAHAIAISTGQGNCALIEGGTVSCWGNDNYGELGQGAPVVQSHPGDGTWAYSTTALAVPGLSGVMALSANEDHVCALLESEAISCWGRNDHGQLGTGNLGFGLVPGEVQGLEGSTQIATGWTSCSLRTGGHVDCWGGNEFGAVGDGTTVDANRPVEVPGISGATQVAAGADHSCAVGSTGHVDCWGANDSGQLGNGTRTYSTTPVEVSGISEATAVGVGGSFSCALLSSGKIECWGWNEGGRLGDGSTENRPVTLPVEVLGITNATQIATGSDSACALLEGGHVKCWGWLAGSGTPSEVKGLTGVAQIAVGGFHACAALVSGHAVCWGEGDLGQLGDGLFEQHSATPVAVTGVTNATQVAAGDQHSCALLSSGHVDCWGRNYDGQLGTNDTPEESAVPLETQGLTNATAISAGGENTCAQLPEGHAACWGSDGAGQLGTGAAWSYTPGAVVGIP
jgi:alpha-tubulin suppressor-like RCC1 family protein